MEIQPVSVRDVLSIDPDDNSIHLALFLADWIRLSTNDLARFGPQLASGVPTSTSVKLYVVDVSEPEDQEVYIEKFPISSDLPRLAVVRSHRSYQFVDTPGRILSDLLKEPTPGRHFTRIVRTVREAMSNDTISTADCLRLFISGDKSSVGKSSVCLGLLSSLLQTFPAHQIGYIKPATQNETPQLVEIFCEEQGIEYQIGPLIYYRGFTRAFLNGETESSEELLDTCRAAVDRMARFKSIVVIDGVGFPSVGSICGTCNGRMAATVGAPVLLVSGPGVGAAIDAYNLNATYFASFGVPVLGAIFNKLPEEGYYSLDKCRVPILQYFSQYQPNRRAFGFLPVLQNLSNRRSDFIRQFREYVDVDAVLEATRTVKSSANSTSTKIPPIKRVKPVIQRSRTDIETAAIQAGAAPSA